VTLFGTSNARGYAAADATRLDRLYAETREQEWSEFRADCGKYLAELDQEEALGKFTPSRSSRRKSRAWTGCAAGTGTDAREISSRRVLAAVAADRLRRAPFVDQHLLASPAATDAVSDLKMCQQHFEAYAEHVYRAVGSRPQD